MVGSRVGGLHKFDKLLDGRVRWHISTANSEILCVGVSLAWNAGSTPEEAAHVVDPRDTAADGLFSARWEVLAQAEGIKVLIRAQKDTADVKAVLGKIAGSAQLSRRALIRRQLVKCLHSASEEGLVGGRIVIAESGELLDHGLRLKLELGCDAETGASTGHGSE